jgi:hypothetical protein
LVRALIRDLAAPIEQRFAPTRWLLLCCFEATHGVGCALSEVHRGVLSHSLRETALVSLFVRLTGSQRRHPSAESSAMYAEATMIHRRVRSSGARGPSPSLRRWLLSEPSALASRGGSSAEARADVDVSEAEPGAPSPPLTPARRPTSANGPWPAASAPWSAPLPAFPTASGWTVQRREHKRGFNSSSARRLQPTAGEEATLRDIWCGRRELATAADQPSVTA